jgi:UDPglucose 6-dehydrogenase/GDP-mannose 6-dehydrogenase
MSVLSSVLETNRTQTDELLRLIGKHFSSLEDVPVTVLGLAFKPDTDDTRESPAFPVIRKLRELGAHVTAYDPVARPVGHEALEGVSLAPSLAEALRSAAIVVLVTRWAEFSDVGHIVREQGSTPLIVDGRRMLNPADFDHYEGIGR